MEPAEGKTIPIVFADPPGSSHAADDRQREATLGPREVFASAGRFVEKVPVDKLQKSLTELSGSRSTLLADLRAVGGFQLSEVRVGVELTAEGGVNLIGSLTAGAKGALELTFKPSEPEK